MLSSLMTTAIGQSVGIFQEIRIQQAGMLNGFKYATLHSLDKETADKISNAPEISYSGKYMNIGEVEIPNTSMTIQLTEYEGNALSIYPNMSKLDGGRMPQSANEVALPQNAIDMMGNGLKIGDTLLLRVILAEPTIGEEAKTVSLHGVLAGILDENYLGYSTGTIKGIVGQGTASALALVEKKMWSLDIVTKNNIEFQSAIDDIESAYQLDHKNTQYNWMYLDAIGISYDKESHHGEGDDGFVMYYVAILLVSLLVLVAAGLVIYNVMRINIMKQIRSFGTLRAIGATAKSLYKLIFAMVFIFCIVGIPVGVLFGILLSKTTASLASGFFSPESFQSTDSESVISLIQQTATLNPTFILISASISLLAALIASLPVAAYVSKVSPVTAMREIGQKISRKRRHHKPIRSFARGFAVLNMRRNRGRTYITITSLAMSIAVFIALQAFILLLDASLKAQSAYVGDYAITNQISGFSEEDVHSLSQDKNISTIYTMKYRMYLQDEIGNGSNQIKTNIRFSSAADALTLIGYDLGMLKKQFPELSNGQLEELTSGAGCLVLNPFAISEDAIYDEYKKNDNIEISNHSMSIVEISETPLGYSGEGFANGVQVIVCEKTFDALTGSNRFQEIYPELKETADVDQFEEIVNQMQERIPGTYVTAFRNAIAQLGASAQNITIMAWGFIILITLIGLLNIVNTTYTNIHMRISEIGIQRAIGMSKSTLRSTFVWEGAFYGVLATIIGSIAGYTLSCFIHTATSGEFSLSPVPIFSILVVALAAMGVCILATTLPLRRIESMDITTIINRIE
jgi:ABC-type antimicrobial peptide transport system permease subunit